MDAVEDATGKRCNGRFQILNSYENRVYLIEFEDDSAVVGKFYRPGRWDHEALEQEHEFTAALHDAEVPVAMPLSLAAGSTIGAVDDINFALFPRIRGAAPQELSDTQVEVLGRLIARVHNVGAVFSDELAIGQVAKCRGRLDVDHYGRANLEIITPFLPDNLRESFIVTAEALFSRFEAPLAALPVHRIHGDCHLGNLVLAHQGPCFLDFDDMLIGPAVQDLWMMVPSFDDEGARQRRLLIDAYRQFRDFADGWLALVEPLRALRFLRYAAWIAKRWEDPIFKRTFSFFGDNRYWEKELIDLREQIARIDLA